MDKVRKIWLLLAATWLAATSYSLANVTRAEDPLDAFPDQAAAVMRIASLDQANAGFRELAARLGLLGTTATQKLEEGLNQAFEVGTDGEAFDRAAPAYIAIFTLDNEQDAAAWLVRAADETRLRRAVLHVGTDEILAPAKRDNGFEKLTKGDRKWYFARFGEWTLYSNNEEVVKLLAFDRSQAKTFASLVEPRGKQILESGDAAIFVNAALLIEKYGDEIAEFRDRMLPLLGSGVGLALAGRPGNANIQAAMKFYGDLANRAFDDLGDVLWLAGRLDFAAAGAEATAMLGVKQASDADELLAANPPSALENLGLLPSGAAAYWAYQVNYRRLLEWDREFAKSIWSEDSPTGRKMLAGNELMTQARLGATASSISFVEGEGLASATLRQAEHPEKIGAALALQLQGYEVKTPFLNGRAEYQANAETYRGRPIDLLTRHLSFNDADNAQIIEKFLGGGAWETRLTTIEGLFLQAAGHDPMCLHLLIDGVVSGKGVAGLDYEFGKTRDRLGDKANLIVLLNVPRMATDFFGLMRGTPPFDALVGLAPFDLGYQPPVSYAGLAVAAEPQAMHLQVYVPVEQAIGVLKFLGQ